MSLAPRPRLVVIDSGVDPRHPGVRGRAVVVPGPAFDDHGVRDPVGGVRDELGHGSAVTAAALQHVQDIEVVAVRVFDLASGCAFARVLHALRWALDEAVRADVVNLSLGTTAEQWREPLAALLRGRGAGVRLVAPAVHEGVPVLPGCLPQVDGVVPDPNVPAALPRACDVDGGMRYWFANPAGPSGVGYGLHARALGVSLATANVSGFLLAHGLTR